MSKVPDRFLEKVKEDQISVIEKLPKERTEILRNNRLYFDSTRKSLVIYIEDRLYEITTTIVS